MDQFTRDMYVAQKIDSKNLDKVSEFEKKFEEFFGVKRQAISDRASRPDFPDIPAGTANSLNDLVYKNYRKEKSDVLSGKCSLRSYKDSMPIPVPAASVKFSEELVKYTNEAGEEKERTDHFFTWQLSREESIKFCIFYGKDRCGARKSMKDIVSGIKKHGAASVEIRDNKIFLLLPVKDEVEKAVVDPNVSVGVDLGIAVPAVVATADGKQKKFIGNGQDFIRLRTRIQAMVRNCQRSLGSVRSGSGRDRKLVPLLRYKNREKNFVREDRKSVV
jgi:transposase